MSKKKGRSLTEPIVARTLALKLQVPLMYALVIVPLRTALIM